MTAGLILLAPFEDADRRLLKDAQVPFFLPGTTTLAKLWADRGKVTPAGNPVRIDKFGNLPVVFADSGVYEYELRGVRLAVEVFAVAQDLQAHLDTPHSGAVHNHDTSYSAITHTHDLTHNHDTTYSAITHTHPLPAHDHPKDDFGVLGFDSWDDFNRPDADFVDSKRMSSNDYDWVIATTVVGNRLAKIRGGKLYYDSDGAGYYYIVRGAYSRIEAEFSFGPGSTTGAAIALVSSKKQGPAVTGADGIATNSIHFTVSPAAWSIGIFDGVNLKNWVAQQAHANGALAVDKAYRCGIERIALDRIRVRLPNGPTQDFTDAQIQAVIGAQYKIDDWWGNTPLTEHFHPSANHATNRLLAIHSFGVAGAGHEHGVDPHTQYALDTDLSGHIGVTTAAHGGIVASTDARLADQRVPTDASVTDAKVAGTAAIAESKLALASDAVATTPSRRTLGTGAQQAAAGNDPRLSDARTPTAHAGSHGSAGADPVTPAAIGAAAASHGNHPSADVAGGYAALDSGLLVPRARLGGGTADATTVLHGDGTWKAPAASAHPSLADHDTLGLATQAELDTHAADVNRHGGIRRVPGLYASFGIVPSNTAGVAGTLYLAPVLLAEGVPIDELAIWCQTAVAASTFTIGIFEDNGNFYPGNRLHRTAALDTATTGAKFEAAAITMPRPIVWMGGVSLGGAPTITWGFGSIWYPFLHSRPSTHYLGASIQAPNQTEVPAVAPAGMTTVNGCPRVFFRMA